MSSSKGPGHYSTRTLTDPETGKGLRASKLRGKLHRLNIRQANTPSDQQKMHYIKAGSMR